MALDARLVSADTAEIVAAVTGKGEKKQSNISVDYDWHHLDLNSEEFRATNLGIALREATDQVAKQFGRRSRFYTRPVEAHRLCGLCQRFKGDPEYRLQ